MYQGLAFLILDSKSIEHDLHFKSSPVVMKDTMVFLFGFLVCFGK